MNKQQVQSQMTTSPDNHAGALLRIDLAALQANWHTMNALSGKAECGAAVKADGYGIGMARAGAALFAAGCRTFFVSQATEGAQLRPHVGDAVIYVLNGPLVAALPLYQDHNLRPVLNSVADMALWRSAAPHKKAALHIDTGMARLGFCAAEIAVLAKDASWREGLDIALVMSHFAAADLPKDPINDEQISLFDTARTKLGLPDVPASIANSAGIMLGARAHYDMVRPGIALYGAGLPPMPENPLRQVVELSAKILQVRAINAGQSIGYGGAFVASCPSLIATVPVGYADGYPRSLSHVGTASIDGHIVPVVGRISMDLLMLDLTGLPGDLAKAGQPVTLLGEPVNIDGLARAAGTVAYELLTNLSRRIPRIYAGD